MSDVETSYYESIYIWQTKYCLFLVIIFVKLSDFSLIFLSGAIMKE